METRRTLLGRVALGLGVLACDGALGRPMMRAVDAAATRAAYVGIETSGVSGRSRARFITTDGDTAATLPLDFRAHGLARANDLLAIFPRRPGTRFALVDMVSLDVRTVVDAPAGRHFYGHGAFTADGRHLLVTENDLETLEGSLAIYETAKGRRLDQLSLPRPGPHDIRRVGETDTFHIALGGLMTHPDYGRTPLNRNAFTSEVVTLDAASGRVEAMGRWAGAEGVSLRHLAGDDRGRLYVGGQRVDLAGGSAVLWLIDGSSVEAIDVGSRLGGYVSSVAARGGEAIVTSKETGRVLRLNGGRIAGSWHVEGASAAALTATGLVTSGYAQLHIGSADVAVSRTFEFDNHGLGLA